MFRITKGFNRPLRTDRLTQQSRRKYSQSQKTYPFNKLRAFPFQLSPEDAIVQMAPFASAFCMFEKFLGSLGARILPGFGFQSFRPVRITPVYFPGWIIDAEVSIDVKRGDTQYTTTGCSKDSYFPGSDFRVLSWVSYGSGATQKAVPFTEDLKHQHGVDVNCIPFTISPFTGLDLAKSMSEPIQLQDDISFQPKSINPHLFAVYPILFPLYLAQYKCPLPEGKEKLVTLFIEAATVGGRIRSEKLDKTDDIPYLPKALTTDLLQALEDVDVPCLNNEPAPFFKLSGFFLPSKKRGLSTTLEDCIRDAIVSHGMGPQLVEKSGIISSDDDPRIRPYTLEERTSVLHWLLLSQEIESMSRVTETLKKTHELSRATEKALPQNVFDKTIESLESKVRELQAKKDNNTPTWWTEWKNMSRTK